MSNMTKLKLVLKFLPPVLVFTCKKFGHLVIGIGFSGLVSISEFLVFGFEAIVANLMIIDIN